MLSKIKR